MTSIPSSLLSIIELTRRNRRMAVHLGGFSELLMSYVISDDGSGNPISVNPEGLVILFDYDTSEKKVLAPGFETFIRDRFGKGDLDKGCDTRQHRTLTQ